MKKETSFIKNTSSVSETNDVTLINFFKCIVLGMVGVFIFSMPIEFDGKITIPLNHIVGLFKSNAGG